MRSVSFSRKFPKGWTSKRKQMGFIINPYRYAVAAPIGPNGDAWLNDTVLNLRGVGTNGQTTTVDDSTSAHAVTFNGNAQIATDQFLYGTSSYKFDGTGDYLTLDGSSEFAPGAGDFTLEIAYRPAASGTVEMLYDGRPASTNGLYLTVYRDASNKLIFYTNSAVRITGTANLTSGSWYRIKICKSNGVTKAFVGGAQDGSNYTDANTYINGASRPALGASGHTVANDNLNGHLSHIRFTRAARFPSAFKSDTTEYSSTNWLDGYWNDVICHIDGDGVDGATTVTDRSIDAATWTFNGNAQIDTAQSYLGSSSILFDGTGDWIDTPDTANWNLSTGDFTIEFDIRFNSIPGSIKYIAGQIDSSLTLSTASFAFTKTAANKIMAECYSGGAAVGNCTGATTIVANTWYRVIYQRRETGFSLILDTVQDASATSSATITNSASKVAFGRAGEYASDTFDGWLANIRGTRAARYVAPIIRPRLLHPRSEGDLYPWHVVLQTEFDGTDASTAFTDVSKYARTLTPRGNAQVDTAQSKFGGASGLFDGTGDYIEMADAAEFSHGTSDFTIEGHFRFPSVPASDYYLYAQGDASATQASRSILLYKSSGNKISGISYSGTAAIVTTASTTSVVANTWYYGVFSKRGSDYYLILDTAMEHTQTSATAINDSASALSLGRFGVYTGGGDHNGWIDSFRHTMGVCRKSTSGIIRRAAFPIYGW